MNHNRLIKIVSGEELVNGITSVWRILFNKRWKFWTHLWRVPLNKS